MRSYGKRPRENVSWILAISTKCVRVPLSARMTRMALQVLLPVTSCCFHAIFADLWKHCSPSLKLASPERSRLRKKRSISKTLPPNEYLQRRSVARPTLVGSGAGAVLRRNSLAVSRVSGKGAVKVCQTLPEFGIVGTRRLRVVNEQFQRIEGSWMFR